ncbi:DUF724 domain-containing protein 3 isoform X2 [Brachypodium distachyon]|uniref:DUF724 domain-containing protein 3 isoform X2 n=1 Tax=Brachypodium distachyon TaxID=15368 RepID=UPI0001C70C53|nr:DUF724 domain-containing protein 3 isoform X2 [Brachypodium distachyon]|eukprot:XP_003577462.2 DUF724 domain-containing protein 3 isoform X2 [Brachypodium distachyon]
MPSPSPKQTGRRRSRSRGWSSSPKDSSRRPPQSPGPSSPQPLAQLPPLPPGTEVEVRVDDDGFHGSWFEATVEAFVPAQRRGSRPRCTVAYTHLPPDHPDAATTLVELSHIRPRPPLSSPEAEPFRLHEIVEAFHEDGWRSGIVLATGPLAVAFPITREVVAFQEPHHVRPRRDYVDGQWAPSQAAVAVQPKRAARVYAVGEKVEVVRDRELYGVSWYPATVAKAIDTLSYLVEYLDLKDEKGTGMLTEYLHYRFIRPAVRWEGGFWLGPGAAVEAYREGAWSAGVVRRHVGESKYEISIDGKEAELLLTTVQELLKPQYNWNGKYWNIVRAKRKGNERQSISGEHPSSSVEVASNDDEHKHHTESSSTKRSRIELMEKTPEELTDGSKNAPECEMNRTLSVLRKSSASSSLPSGRNNFRVLPQRIVSSCTVPMKGKPHNRSRADVIPMKGLGLHHASSENPKPHNRSRADVIGEVNHEILSEMLRSDGQLNTRGTSADEAHDMLPTAGLIEQKMDSNCINNAAQQMEIHEMHPIQALRGNSDDNDNLERRGHGTVHVNEVTIQRIQEPIESICGGQDFQDGERVDERPTEPHVQNAASSHCTIGNTPFRSCSVSGSSLNLTLGSHQIEHVSHQIEHVSITKTSCWWDLCRDIQQQPHFLPLQEFVPELREGMALGLMVAYVSLVDSIKKSCIEDSIASFEGKISALAYLERNGFDVKFLQLSLDRLLQMKRNHAKHLERVDKLKELLPEKESIMSGKYVLLREKEEAICQLQQKLECLHGEVEQIAKEAKDEDAEISRLKEDVNITLQERDDVVLRFQSVQAELCSTLHISD